MALYIELQDLSGFKTLSLVASFTGAAIPGEGVKLAYFDTDTTYYYGGDTKNKIKVVELPVSYDDLKQQLIEGEKTGKIPSFKLQPGLVR